MKLYKGLTMYKRGTIEKPVYVLELITNGGYANEYYEYNDKNEAIKAYGRAHWLKEHHFCKQEFEPIEKHTTTQQALFQIGLTALKAYVTVEKWILS